MVGFHAVQRYLERIAQQEVNAHLLTEDEYRKLETTVCELFMQSKVVTGRYYYNEEHDVVFVFRPDIRMIVTCYRSNPHPFERSDV